MAGVIAPIRQVQVQLQQANAVVRDENAVRVISSIEELQRGIPPCMIKAVLTFPPIRKLAEDGRIDAWGIDVTRFPDEDEYGRLIANGTMELLPENKDEDGDYMFTWEWSSTDPQVDPDELLAIEETREFLAAFLEDEETKYLDPTAVPYGQLRG